jgi:TolB-like protein/DNA-binding winged helix-turn-helix (wHTH) protein/Flp pilus assembly protein TadD
MPTPESREIFRFGDFELDVAAYELRRQGRPVRLERQPMDLLILLVQHRRQLVPRSDIIDRLWGKDVFVDVETGVHTAVRKIRHALRDSSDAPAFVETVSGKGYRFIARVEVVADPRTDLTETAPAGVSTPPGVIAASDTVRPESTRVVTEQELASLHQVKRPNRARLAIVLAAVVMLAGFATWAWLDAGAPAIHLTIAVLPFENLSSDHEREYLADGLAEETIAALGQIDFEHVSVIARTSTLPYKGLKKSVAEIGGELGADYLVEGSIRAENGLLRITPRLIRVRDQVQVWSSSYDRAPISVLGMQRELSSAIAEQVRLRLSPDRLTALERRQTRNPEAYDLYLRGRYFGNQRTPEMNARAVRYYESAIALDPHYALAWSGLADTHAASAINADAPPLTVGPRANEAATQAFQAQPQLAEVQSSRGYVSFLLDWDWTGAEAAMRRAIELNPRYALGQRRLGVLLSQMGRHEEARAVMHRARELDPLEPMQHSLSSQVAFQARDSSAAVEHARQSTIIDPEFWIGYMQLAQAYEQLGKTATALEALNRAGRFSERNSKALSLRGYLFAKLGRADEAREVLRMLEAVSRDRYVPPYAMALVHAGLGEREAVFDWLNKAYSARDVHLQFLPVDPKWDPYRADPQFKALLERCGFTRASKPGPLTQ